MSAILSDGSWKTGIGRYRTTFKIIVHSHNSDGPIDLSDSVVSVTTNKTIKSMGSLSFALVGDKPWLNYIFPNDYINVYVDRADGQGWTRLFFGFLDHIEETIQTEGNGSPRTSYLVQCSDFQKAFERTCIYFNPFVAARGDFTDGAVGLPGFGLGLMTRGLAFAGSPADLVINVTNLLLGFASQLLLPTSYNPRFATRLRRQRAELIINRLPEDARRQILDIGSYSDFLEKVRQETNTTSPVGDLTNPNATDTSAIAQAEQRTFSAEVIRRLSAGSTTGTETPSVASERGIEAYNVLNTTTQGYPPCLLDLVDIQTFIERTAMDGYALGFPLWEQQGTVLSFLRFVSNEIVNELFFDLRLLSADGGITVGSYDREYDDIEGNKHSDGVSANGLTYQPAIVMREYPFSTISKVDVPVDLSIRSTAAAPASAMDSLGKLYFGAIFSNEPNVPGRHIVVVPNMNLEDRASGVSTGPANKHLDVAVVHDVEITTSKLARSDSDNFNLTEIIASPLSGEHYKFFMMDLLPIITPIQILRNGLRVRSLTTNAATIPPTIINRLQPLADPATDPTPQAPPTVALPASPMVTPVELVIGGDGTYTQGFISINSRTSNAWNYRQKTFNGTRHYNSDPSQSVPVDGTPYWRFHNGVDIVGNRGTPIRAVKDGFVVAAVPFSAVNGYGNMVVIWHPTGDPEQGPLDPDYYTLYAHLDSFNSDTSMGPNLVLTSGSNVFSHFASKELISGGHMPRVAVLAGQTIGLMGNSGGEGSERSQNASSTGVHLHFEVNVRRNGRVYPSSFSRRGPIQDVLLLDSPTKPANPSEEETISQDPQRILGAGVWNVVSTVHNHATGTDVGVVGLPLSAIPDTDTIDDSGDADDSSDSAPQTPPSPTPEATQEDPSPVQNTSHANVDNSDIRRQIARWALLNDMWYQHNLEYLSGSIDMRGAPEIRVGYRLDLVDRNLSCYVEGVSHTWSYGKEMRTTLHVTRGQPNNPFPAYVFPYIKNFDRTVSTTQRTTNSRLGTYFITPDPISVRRALKLDSRVTNGVVTNLRGSGDVNETDNPDANGDLSAKYGNEYMLSAETIAVDLALEAAMDSVQQDAPPGSTSTVDGTSTPTTRAISSLLDSVSGEQAVDSVTRDLEDL